ncbi:TPA: cytochrome P450 [Pseudomonas aeruginosa]|uniref:Cytochrome P450 n=2 Tax=Gammaproteobacteria TaxID=1236 RepID=A0A7M3B4G9_PSEAI|nr:MULTISPECIES: cytochrome P450 [Pseudomonas]EAZ58731.1 P450 monooxygenase [Pseudomonas aeruginosa 2192]AVN41991.1 cytochrome P450 [Pseudomonas aeruginosa]AVZ19078.1 cytochrome P450 [Pseudomonas aeruginosa]AXL83109.1 Cytochrome P450 [Pseudomonas aeruginosa]AXO28548.1 Cytochrome P450 [Pseudomonas aeruginosa]
MSGPAQSNLEQVFADVASNYRGADIDLHAVYREMREKSPVLPENFMARLGVPSIAGLDPDRPVFTLFKYDDVMAVMRDASNYTSGFIAEGLGAFFDGLILTAMDGDAHKSMRTLLQPVFMPETVNRWKETKIDRVIREEYLQPMVASKKADIMEFALYFPIRVIYSLIGFPEDRPEEIEQYAAWALAILAGPQVDPEKAAAARGAAMEAAQALYDVVKVVVAQRRAEGATGDDLISRLISAEYEGRSLDDHEIATFVRSLLPAASETTTRTFGTLLTLLLERPELLARIRADRSLVNKAIDEAVRYEPVATFKVRQTAKDVVIRGVSIPKGAMVSCIVSSANRDEDAFENADTFDIDRRAKPSFGFGFGPHMCIGQFVAKTEINCALNAVLDLMPNIRLDPDKPAPEIIGAQLRGPHQVHVIWD